MTHKNESSKLTENDSIDSLILSLQCDSLYELWIMKFSVDHKYITFCSILQKFWNFMHVSHKYDLFQRRYEI